MRRGETEPTQRTLLTSMRVKQNDLRINRAVFKEGAAPTIDMRLWYMDDNEEWAPGKGLNIPASKWPQFMEAVQKADEVLKEKFAKDLERAASNGSSSTVDLRDS